MQKIDLPTAQIISFQQELRLAVPLIFGCKEYQEQVLLVERIDVILKKSGLEKRFVELSMEEYEAKMDKEGKVIEGWMRVEHFQWSERAIRCTILRHLLGESYRGMSKRLAECQLFRNFCKIKEFEVVRVPGKSTLEVYEHYLPEEKFKAILTQLSLALNDEEKAEEMGLEEALKMEIAYVDTTCLEANIHFPTDWILMRDGIHSLIRTITTIRKHGLKIRMPEPSSFISEINSLCIAMHAAGKAWKKKERKNIIRAMKKLAEFESTQSVTTLHLTQNGQHRHILAAKKQNFFFVVLISLLISFPKP